MFRHEAPSDPDRIGMRFGQSLFEALVVEVGALSEKRLSIRR